MKFLKDWTIDAPWGKLAMVSWGSPTGDPVLLVHGRQDSAATFEPLLQMLPETFHYVAIDLPGHGRSDPFPKGVMISRLHFVGAVQAAVRHLRWKEFIYMGHSLGCEAGLFFNAVYPGRVSRLVLLDPGPALARLQIHDPEEYMASFHHQYYDNYDKFDVKRLYSKQRAQQAVMKARGFSEPQAAQALARSLLAVGDDLYQLSWDLRLKYPAPPNYPTDYYYQLFSRTSPPTLLVAATDSPVGYGPGKLAALRLISDLEANLENFTVVAVKGGHDVHFTNPERIVKGIREFLEKNDVKSKL